jgi:hypothetical protein
MTTGKYERFTLYNPQRVMARLLLPSLGFAAVWVPIVWLGGNIIDRNVGTGVFFFGVSYGWIVVLFFVWRKTARNMLDPGKNYVELRDDHLLLTFGGLRRPLRIQYTNVAAAARLRAWSGLPALFIQRVSPTPPPTRLTLKTIDLRTTFSGLGFLNSVRLEPVDPAAMAGALAEHLAPFGVDTRTLVA